MQHTSQRFQKSQVSRIGCSCLLQKAGYCNSYMLVRVVPVRVLMVMRKGAREPIFVCSYSIHLGAWIRVVPQVDDNATAGSSSDPQVNSAYNCSKRQSESTMCTYLIGMQWRQTELMSDCVRGEHRVRWQSSLDRTVWRAACKSECRKVVWAWGRFCFDFYLLGA